jgi:hypothetical protein
MTLFTEFGGPNAKNATVYRCKRPNPLAREFQCAQQLGGTVLIANRGRIAGMVLFQ